MRQQDVPTRAPARPGPYIVVAALLVLGIVLPLIVPIYARDEPRLIGLPFFYWYQMLWVLIEAALLFICYLIVRAEERRRRAALSSGDGTKRSVRS